MKLFAELLQLTSTGCVLDTVSASIFYGSNSLSSSGATVRISDSDTIQSNRHYFLLSWASQIKSIITTILLTLSFIIILPITHSDPQLIQSYLSSNSTKLILTISKGSYGLPVNLTWLHTLSFAGIVVLIEKSKLVKIKSWQDATDVVVIGSR